MIILLSNFTAVLYININNCVLINNYDIKDCIENIEINFDIGVNGYLF